MESNPQQSSNNQKAQQIQTKVYSWGAGFDGQLGVDLKKTAGQKKCMILPTLIPKMKNITKISLYSNYSLCLNKEGHVFGFGSNFKGRMGFSSNIQDQVFIPLQVPVLVNIVKIDAGYFHSLALDREGQAWSAGSGLHGELGRQVQSELFGKVEQKESFKDVIAGFNMSFFITYEGSQLYTCGKNLLEQRFEKAKNSGMKIFVQQNSKIFKDMGITQYQPQQLKYFEKIKIRQVDCGLKYVFVVSEDGDLYCWGDNSFKQLGLCDENIKYVKNPRQVEYFSKNNIKVKQVSCAKGEKHQHTGCLTWDNAVYMWGDPYKGQLGTYLDEKGWTHEETSLYGTPLKLSLEFLKEPPQLKQSNNYAEDPMSPSEDLSPMKQKSEFFEPDTVVKVVCGGIHSGLLTQQGRVYTFGCGSDGRLGQQEFEGHTYLYKESKPKYVQKFHNMKVLDLQSSYYHMMALVQVLNENS